jgi:acetoin utilization deacetylase AcuC-like enzyme
MNSDTLPSGIVYDNCFLKHDTGNHPESAERLEQVYAFLSEKGAFEKTQRIEPYPAPSTTVAYVHTQAHIHHVKHLAAQGGGMLDLDTLQQEVYWHQPMPLWKV